MSARTPGVRALAPLFRARTIRSTNVTIPVELVLDIVRLAAASDSRVARILALVCRNVYSEVDTLRFRVMHWRYPHRSGSIATLFVRRGRQFLPDNLQSLHWDWSHSNFSERQLLDVHNCLEWLRYNLSGLRLSVLALNVDVIDEFAALHDSSALKELMCLYDSTWPGWPADLQLPYPHLTRLLLHNFPLDSWPASIFGCKALTHLALDVVHSQDEAIAQAAADAITWFRIRIFGELPVLERFLFILMDDGDLPQFKNAEIYADAIWEDEDDRGRIDFDTIPCDWDRRWWRSRTQDCEARRGTDFWDTGSVVPLSLQLAEPPLLHFLHSPQ
ncbi:hypothetical protein AURDEDRAFT_126180 [Auricularia subglabra TFB-10046 SS5]|nr:hypothetical protein AURDEDRAFT_126180 [Auricularia subglabra TFB-10046 SS5]